jgi:hypothetical protein
MIDGILLIDRAMLRNKMWTRDTPFSEGQAWVDLLGVTNQTPASFKTKNDRLVDLDPGQCGWSQVGLANRWGWPRNKVSKILERWKREGRIDYESDGTTTIITVVNYVDYQQALKQQLCSSEAAAKQQDDSKSTRIGIGIGITECTEGIERGSGNSNHPPLTVILDHFAKCGAAYTEVEIRRAYLDFENGKAPDGSWMLLSGRPGPVADWRASVAHQIEWRRDQQQKNAPVVAAGSVDKWSLGAAMGAALTGAK